MSEARRTKRARDAGLLKEACRSIERFEPEMVLSENVAGIGGPRYGCVWDEFLDDLERMGYATGSKVVCTSRFGIPQYRKRSILIGVKRRLVRRGRFADLLEAELFVESLGTLVTSDVPEVSRFVVGKYCPQERLT